MTESTARPRGKTHAVLTGWAALVYGFFNAPIILLFIFSFSDHRNVGPWGGFTLD